MKKKILIFAIVFVCLISVFAFTGCDNNDNNTPSGLTGTEATFKNFSKTGETEYSISVSNDTQMLNMSNIVEISNKSSWILTSDIQGNNSISSKISTLNIGDNTYYVLVTSNSNDVCLYTLKIRRRPIYLVTFRNSNSYIFTQVDVEEGCCVNQPTDIPLKQDYEFIGWDYDFNQPVSSNITIYANFKYLYYNISYTLNGGTNNSNNPYRYNEETPTITLLDASKRGYVFAGWYNNANFSGNKVNTIKQGNSGNINLYAKFEVIEYTITYVMENGCNDDSNPTTYTVEDEFQIKNAYKPNCIDTGAWFLENTYENQLVKINKGTIGNIVLYSKFTNDGVFDNDGYFRVSTLQTFINLPKTLNYNIKLFSDINLENIEWEPISLYDAVFDGNNYIISNLTITEMTYNYYNGELGLFASIYNSHIKNLCIENANINVSSFGTDVYAGVLVGYQGNNCLIEKCSANGLIDIFARDGAGIHAGGLVGYCKSNVNNCFSNVKVIADVYYDDGFCYAGGLVGYLIDGQLETSFALGNVISSNNDYPYAGGLVAYLKNGQIKNCFALGNCKGIYHYGAYVGGLLGFNNNGTIIESYRSKSQEIILDTAFTNEESDYGTLSETSEIFDWIYNNWDSTIWNLFTDKPPLFR